MSSGGIVQPIFILAAIASGAFAALVWARRQDDTRNQALTALLAAQAIWALNKAVTDAADIAQVPLTASLEALRVLAWTTYVLSLARLIRGPGPRKAMAFAIACTLAAATAVSAWTAAPATLSAATQLAALAFALLCAIVLLRMRDRAREHLVQALLLAAVVALGFDALMYRQVLGGEPLDRQWSVAQAAINILVIPLLLARASHEPAQPLGIVLSRHMGLRMIAALFTVLGVLLAGAALFFIRYFAGTWADSGQLVVLAAVVSGLIVIAASARLRARLRVFAAKHFLDYRYDYREEWLRLTRMLSEAGQLSSRSLAERGIDGIGSLVESRGGALWLLEGKHYELIAERGRGAMRPAALPADLALFEWLATRRWIIDLDEWRRWPARYSGLVISAPLDDARARLLVPMIVRDELAGLVVLDQPLAPLVLDWEVRDVLKAAAAQVGSFLAVQRTTERLAQAEQFATFNRMSAFIIHDLKNLAAQLSLLSSNARRHRDNPAFIDDMLGTIDAVTSRMLAILTGLRTPLPEKSHPETIVVHELLATAVNDRGGLWPRPELHHPDTAPIQVHADRARLERVIGHLVQNAIEACAGLENAAVSISYDRFGMSVHITVADTGRGMSDEFIARRLFRPFNSTKPHGMGIGLFECREYIRELGGSLTVESSLGHGTRFTVVLPVVDPLAGKRNG